MKEMMKANTKLCEQLDLYKSVLDEVRALKKEWLDNTNNETLVFENNTLIEFMNKLHYILDKVKESE